MSDKMELPYQSDLESKLASFQQMVRGPSLRQAVESLVQRHLATMGAQNTRNLYELVMFEVEQALMDRVLDFTDGNESRTAKILGISRGTLRQRRKLFGHYEHENMKEEQESTNE